MCTDTSVESIFAVKLLGVERGWSSMKVCVRGEYGDCSTFLEYSEIAGVYETDWNRAVSEAASKTFRKSVIATRVNIKNIINSERSGQFKLLDGLVERDVLGESEGDGVHPFGGGDVPDVEDLLDVSLVEGADDGLYLFDQHLSVVVLVLFGEEGVHVDDGQVVRAPDLVVGLVQKPK